MGEWRRDFVFHQYSRQYGAWLQQENERRRVASCAVSQTTAWLCWIFKDLILHEAEVPRATPEFPIGANNIRGSVSVKIVRPRDNKASNHGFQIPKSVKHIYIYRAYVLSVAEILISFSYFFIYMSIYIKIF